MVRTQGETRRGSSLGKPVRAQKNKYDDTDYAKWSNPKVRSAHEAPPGVPHVRSRARPHLRVRQARLECARSFVCVWACSDVWVCAMRVGTLCAAGDAGRAYCADGRCDRWGGLSFFSARNS